MAYIGQAPASIPLTASDIQSGVIDGKQTIWVPAVAMYPNSTNGCADLDQTELANGPEIKTLLDVAEQVIVSVNCESTNDP